MELGFPIDEVEKKIGKSQAKGEEKTNLSCLTFWPGA